MVYIFYLFFFKKDDDTRDKQFIGKLRYEYEPESSSVQGIQTLCETSYKDLVVATLENMSTRLRDSCINNYGEVGVEVTLRFLPDDTIVNIQNDGRTVSFVY